jgi:mono/diheme cytochrome c family protein
MPLLAGCGGDETGTSAPSGQTEDTSYGAGGLAGAAKDSAPTPKEEAQQIFGSRCATCHGQEGRGNGPGAQLLNPKPRNFHDKKFQETVKDSEMEQAIIYGGIAVGRSPKMASNPDLQSKPEVVKALIAHVRELGKQD